MYNFALAFLICAAAYFVGEIISTLTKAWIPSVFVTAVVFLVGYWTVFPHDVVGDAKLIEAGSTLGIYLVIVHVGTMLSVKQLLAQWKTVIVCLIGLAGMCGICYFLCPVFMDRNLMIAGLPPLTGGIVAATMMKRAALEKGLEMASVFAVTMYCVQGFAGYPLTAICLQIEGKRLLKSYRAGELKANKQKNNSINNEIHQKKLIPPIPEKFNSTVLMLGKAALVAWLSMVAGGLTGISGAILALVFGVIFTSLGFLEPNILAKANSYGFLVFALTMYVFDGLKDCTPQILASIILPMVILIAFGVIALIFVACIIAKVLRISVPLSIASCLTALYGFPFNVVMTDATCDALTQDAKEREFLSERMLPSMLVGGFTTVTIASVFIAGIFINLL